MASDTRDDKLSRLDRNTLIPISVAVAGLLMALGFHAWLSTQLQLLDRRLERIEDRLATSAGDRWHYTDMRLWCERLGKANPSITVPDPRDVVVMPVRPTSGGR